MPAFHANPRYHRIFSLIGILVLLLTACAPAPATTGGQAGQPAAEAPAAAGSKILLYGGNQDIDNIDPATGENYSINAALVSLYDALFITRGNELQPNLVESYEVSDDAMVFTFKLKADATDHGDGGKMHRCPSPAGGRGRGAGPRGHRYAGHLRQACGGGGRCFVQRTESCGLAGY